MNKNRHKAIRALAHSFLLTSISVAPVIADQWKTRAEIEADKTNTAASSSTRSVDNTPVEQISNTQLQPSTTSNDFLKHRAASDVPAGERLLIKTKIQGKDGVKLARVYFKTASADRYSFVVLNKGERSVYTAEIPAAGKAVSAIEYKIVVQDAFGEVHKTDKYKVAVSEAASNQVSQSNSFINVFSEYPEETAQPEFSGFVDNVRFTYGVTKLLASTTSSVGGVVGSSSASAGSASTATAATGAATTGGLSTTALVAGGVVVAGGAVAASGGGSSSGSSGGSESVSDVGDAASQSDLQGSSGDVRVNLDWFNGSDSEVIVDVYVTDPCGNLIGFDAQSSASCNGYTGTWDQDANQEQDFENIAWSDGAPQGDYSVDIQWFSGTGSVNYTLTIISGSERQELSGTVSDSQTTRQRITSFSF